MLGFGASVGNSVGASSKANGGGAAIASEGFGNVAATGLSRKAKNFCAAVDCAAQ